MQQIADARTRINTVIGGRLDPSKAVIANDNLFNKFRIRCLAGRSVYLSFHIEDPNQWSLKYGRKTVMGRVALEETIPYFNALGWLLPETPDAAPAEEPAATPVLQLTLPEVLRGWNLAVPHYIGNAIADLLRSAKLPAPDQTAALQDAARNIELAIAELAAR
jgi:hypothetical protein